MFDLLQQSGIFFYNKNAENRVFWRENLEACPTCALCSDCTSMVTMLECVCVCFLRVFVKKLRPACHLGWDGLHVTAHWQFLCCFWALQIQHMGARREHPWPATPRRVSTQVRKRWTSDEAAQPPSSAMALYGYGRRGTPVTLSLIRPHPLPTGLSPWGERLGMC